MTADVSSDIRQSLLKHPNWRGTLSLALDRCGNATRLTRRRHQGPLLVQRPFYPEGKTCCHLYLLHPPGGLVGGDQLNCHLTLGSDAQALLTTPSAGKAYRVATDQLDQGQQFHIDLGPRASLEWFPQETIAFNGARPQLRTRIDVTRDSTVIGWDILCLGRPSAAERFERGEVHQQLELWCEDQPLVVEHAQFHGGSRMLRAPWGLHDRPVLGTLYCYHPMFAQAVSSEPASLLGDVRKLMNTLEQDAVQTSPQDRGPLFSATRVNNVLLVRYLGDCTEQCRQLFTAIWRQLRPTLLGRPARAPRIWNT